MFDPEANRGNFTQTAFPQALGGRQSVIDVFGMNLVYGVAF